MSRPVPRARLRAAVLAVASLFVGAAAAQMTPAGLWKTVDDETGKEKSLVRIEGGAGAGGAVTGRIEKLLDPATPAGATCLKCTDERKDQPIVGLTILRNLRQSPGDPAVWEGGDVLDPNNGKVYKARLKPVDGGARLELRGYLGPFYRTQTWIRVE